MVLSREKIAGKLLYRRLIHHEHVELACHDQQASHLHKLFLRGFPCVLLESGIETRALGVHGEAEFGEDDDFL